MIRQFAVVSCIALASAAAHAQDSRLDAIQKSGVLRVCTPGDYKPFSLAKPDAAELKDCIVPRSSITIMASGMVSRWKSSRRAGPS